jgi:hypothetical protein
MAILSIKFLCNAVGRLARMLGGIGLLASCFLAAESVRAADTPPVVTIVQPQAGVASVPEMEFAKGYLQRDFRECAAARPYQMGKARLDELRWKDARHVR